MKAERWMSQQFFIFFMTWGVFLPYWTSWLITQKDQTIEQASLIMSVALIARGVSTLFFYPAISDKLSNRNVLIILGFGALLSCAAYFVSSGFTAVLIVTMLFCFFYPALMPALDATAGVLVQNEKINYGRSRSFGSIGFIVCVILISIITSITGDVALYYAMLVGLIILVLLIVQPVPQAVSEKPVQSLKLKMRNLFKIKGFTVILLIAVLMQGAHASYYSYGYLYLQHLDVAKYYIGFIINIGVLFEIILFRYADKWFKGWSAAKLFILAAIGSSVRWLAAYLFPNVWVFILSQSLHAFSFALAHYAFMIFLTNNVERAYIPKAQGMYSAFALSWSTAILTLFGGYLYEISPPLSFAGMLIFTIPALLIAFITYKKHPMI